MEPSLGRIERCCADAEQQVDRLLAVPLRGAIREPGIVSSVDQQFLRQRRAGLRTGRFCAPHPHRAFIASAPERFGTSLTGEPTAGGHDAVAAGPACLRLCSHGTQAWPRRVKKSLAEPKSLVSFAKSLPAVGWPLTLERPQWAATPTGGPEHAQDTDPNGRSCGGGPRRRPGRVFAAILAAGGGDARGAQSGGGGQDAGDSSHDPYCSPSTSWALADAAPRRERAGRPGLEFRACCANRREPLARRGIGRAPVP